ncbi:MAG: DUF3223 domain-containing protein [Bacteroidia bacterium]|nr:DUF3223 domain-containing protein [Bacteroidia bacterium]
MKIGNIDFKTKKDALNYYKEILNLYKIGETLSEKDKEKIIDLLKIHPDFSRKFSNGIKEIIIEKIPKYNSKAFHILDNNSELEAFSYIKCINGNKPPLTIFSSTCRDIVQDDINNVKLQYFKDNSKNGEVKCQETGELCKWDDLVIDHRQPNTFSVIVDRFIEVNQIDITTIKYIEIFDGVYKFKEDVICEKFREYHKEKANIRIVKKCINSGRAYQGRVKKQKKDLKII